jgi:hypothetical protein
VQKPLTRCLRDQLAPIDGYLQACDPIGVASEIMVFTRSAREDPYRASAQGRAVRAAALVVALPQVAATASAVSGAWPVHSRRRSPTARGHSGTGVAVSAALGELCSDEVAVREALAPQ